MFVSSVTKQRCYFQSKERHTSTVSSHFKEHNSSMSNTDELIYVHKEKDTKQKNLTTLKSQLSIIINSHTVFHIELLNIRSSEGTAVKMDTAQCKFVSESLIVTYSIY